MAVMSGGALTEFRRPHMCHFGVAAKAGVVSWLDLALAYREGESSIFVPVQPLAGSQLCP